LDELRDYHPVPAMTDPFGWVPAMDVANEGKLVAVVPPDEAEAALRALCAHPHGAGAARVGEVHSEPPGIVELRTAMGGTRIVDMLVGDPLPRIC
jgi:hydrogenase expression/formation protein HypE